jgi:hypothetical protein
LSTRKNLQQQNYSKVYIAEVISVLWAVPYGSSLWSSSCHGRELPFCDINNVNNVILKLFSVTAIFLFFFIVCSIDDCPTAYS